MEFEEGAAEHYDKASRRRDATAFQELQKDEKKIVKGFLQSGVLGGGTGPARRLTEEEVKSRPLDRNEIIAILRERILQLERGDPWITGVTKEAVLDWLKKDKPSRPKNHSITPVDIANYEFNHFLPALPVLVKRVIPGTKEYYLFRPSELTRFGTVGD